MQDQRRFAPATQRNQEPIWSVLEPLLASASGTVLEIASGSGEHAMFFAARLAPRWKWQPTDASAEALASIRAWRRQPEVAATLPLEPVLLDAAEPAWAVHRAEAVVCINMVHISPWSATQGLLRGASRVLRAAGGGPLVLYGPYKRGGFHTAPSNEAFDQNLRSRNPEWGVRDLDAVREEAEQHGFLLEEVVAMPANNLTLVFRIEAA